MKIPYEVQTPVKSKRIVTFVAASDQRAYGTALYIRCKYHNDAFTSRLIVAKSKARGNILNLSHAYVYCEYEFKLRGRFIERV